MSILYSCQNLSNSILRIDAFYCKSYLDKSLKSGNKYLQPLLNPHHVLAKVVTKWTVKATWPSTPTGKLKCGCKFSLRIDRILSHWQHQGQSLAHAQLGNVRIFFLPSVYLFHVNSSTARRMSLQYLPPERRWSLKQDSESPYLDRSPEDTLFSINYLIWGDNKMFVYFGHFHYFPKQDSILILNNIPPPPPAKVVP